MNLARKYQSAALNRDYEQFDFSDEQSEILHFYSNRIANQGGIDQEQNFLQRKAIIAEMLCLFSPQQIEQLNAYQQGKVGALFFSNLLNSQGSKFNEYLPEALPLEKDILPTHSVQLIAARSSILLSLLQQQSFAYDIENYGKAIRLVANFKNNNKPCSHSGVSLSAHTETPYFCSKSHTQGHSPAPSALILSALWNPLNEPTQVIPMYSIIESMNQQLLEQLKSPYFDFVRSDSFNEGEGSGGKNISIIEDYVDGSFMLKFNLMRFRVSDTAPALAHDAIEVLKEKIAAQTPLKFALNSRNCLIINNFKTMHCRDIVQDNRRLLIRIFGYDQHTSPIVLSHNPYIVQG